MTYKLLQVGDKIKDGDGWLSDQQDWRPVDGTYPHTIQACELESGTIYRRKVRRTEIKVGDVEVNAFGYGVSGSSVAIAQEIKSGEYEEVSVPIGSAPALAAAILEVAGVEG